jgi:hypothetical protein
MKRTITLSRFIALLLLLPAFVLGQQVNTKYALHEAYGIPKLSSASLHKTGAVTLSMDSVYINQFTNGVKENSQKAVFVYDQVSAKCIEEYGYDWNGFVWNKANRYTYNYDTKGNLTEQVQYGWNGSTWHPGWKNAYTYDSNDMLIEDVLYDFSGGVWRPLMRYSYTLGTNSRLEEKKRFYWNGSSWDAVQKEEYIYDSFDVLLEQLLSSWAGTTWYANEKIIYSYNSADQLSVELHYQWSGISWEKQDSSAYSYDSNGFLNEKVDAFWGGSMWNIDDRITRTNDANGNVLEEIYETWSASNGWEPAIKTESQYDLAYDRSNIAQPNYFSEAFSNKLDSFVAYRWNVSTWEKEADYELFYSNFIDVEEMTLATFSAYPIPVANRLFIRAGEKGDATLYDLTGKQLASWSLERGEQSVDFSAYPTGLYFLHVQGKGVIKVVKQ